MLYARKCKICGKEFSTNNANKYTCSEDCSKENRKRTDRLKYLRNNPGKGAGSRTQSLCFSCKRAYAKPYEAGGCDKILYGTKVYKKAHWAFKEPNKKDAYWVLVVEKCDLYELDYRITRNGARGH